MKHIIDEVVSQIVYTTRWSPHQVYRTLEIAYKWGDRARFHMTWKQRKIWELFNSIFEDRAKRSPAQ